MRRHSEIGLAPRERRVSMPSAKQPAKLCSFIMLMVVLSGSGAPARAGQQPQFRSRVDLVQMQVGVADAEGRFVHGLTAADFVVVVNGEERPVQVAYAVDLRTEDAGQIGEEVPDRPPTRRPVAARRHFVFLFDYSFNTGRGVREARRAAIEFLERTVRESDVVAVATVERRGFQVLIPFTSNRAKIYETLNEIELAGITRRVTYDGRGAFPDYVANVSRYLETLVQFGETLQAVEGRKHLVMFSAGFMDRALFGGGLDEMSSDAEGRASGGLQGIGGTDVDPEYYTGSSDVRAGIADVAEAFLRADAVVYAIDARGLGDRDPMSTGLNRPDGRQVLNYLAQETGGEAFWNMNDMSPALEQIEEATAQFYVIGYQKARSDPATVELGVQVLRVGVEITSSPVRLTPPPEYTTLTRMQRQMQLGELLFDDFDVPGLAMESDIVAFPAPDGGVPGVALFLEVSGLELDRLAALRGTDEVQLELAAFALANDDSVVDTFRRRVTIDVAEMRAAGPMVEQAFRYVDYLTVPAGPGRVRLLVRESAAGALAATTLRHEALSANQADRMVVARPMVIDEAARIATPDHGWAFQPLKVMNRHVAPIPDPRVVPGEVITVLVVVFNPRDRRGDTIGRISFVLEEVASGDSYQVPETRLLDSWNNDTAGATQFLIRMTVPTNVGSGAMHLRVRVATKRSRGQEENRTKLYVGLR